MGGLSQELIEEGESVEGIPVCCEVCALEGTADAACTSVCKRGLCERARDDHMAAAYMLGGACNPAVTDCGFHFENCMLFDALHPQLIDKVDNADDLLYGLSVDCNASAVNAARPDGLFKYLELLDGIPGAVGDLGEVEDVVGYCQDAAQGDGTDGGAGDLDGGGDTGGGSPPPPPRGLPVPCGPYAEQRYWVRPTNNFATWTERSEGVGIRGRDRYPMAIESGGIEYTVLPCDGGSERCLRVDELSVRLRDPDSGFAMALTLVESSSMLAMSTSERFEVPAGGLQLAVRYDWGADQDVLVRASNTDPVQGEIDERGRSISLLELVASSPVDGDAVLSLRGDLVNTQPVPEIVVASGSAWNRITLRSSTRDAESDPVVHAWMIPGVGTWRGDAVEVELPVGRHAVLLYADDVHRARGVTAGWVEISAGGL
jgi:hypothetical protein